MTRAQEILEAITDKEYVIEHVYSEHLSLEKLASYLAELEAEIEENWKHRNDSDD